ncbi:MAG: HEAT repeat domain-containing protein [Myxococcota bacterium]
MMMTDKIILFILLVFFSSGCTTEKERMLIAIKRGNKATRVETIKKMSKSRDPEVVNVIISVLNDYSPLVRRTAAKALENKGIIAAQPLIRRLDDHDQRVRLRTINTLFTLPDRAFINSALLDLLDDPSGKVRQQVLQGFLKKGWKRADLLSIKSFNLNELAVKLLANPRHEDIAMGIKKIGLSGWENGYGFVYYYLNSKDPFILREALQATGTIFDNFHFTLLKKTPRTLERQLALLNLLEKTSHLTESLFDELLALGLSLHDIVKTQNVFNFKVKCKHLDAFYKNNLVDHFNNYDCDVSKDKYGPGEQYYLKKKLGKEIPQQLLQKAGGKINEFSPLVLSEFTKDPELADKVLKMLKKGWDKFIFYFTKWIPEKKWEQLEDVGPVQLPDKEKKAKSLRQRFLEKLKDVKVPYAELLPPPFDSKAYAQKLKSLRKVVSARSFLLKILKKGPVEFQESTLYALYPAKPSLKVPELIYDKVESSKREIKLAALKTLAGHHKTEIFLPYLNSPDQDLRDLAVETLIKHGDKKLIPELVKMFKDKPVASVAKVLGRLKAEEAVNLMFSILKSDSSRALYKERAVVLESLLRIIEPDHKKTDQIMETELWHPSALIRCKAISFLKDKKTIKDYSLFDPAIQVRRCALATLQQRISSEKQP